MEIVSVKQNLEGFGPILERGRQVTLHDIGLGEAYQPFANRKQHWAQPVTFSDELGQALALVLPQLIHNLEYWSGKDHEDIGFLTVHKATRRGAGFNWSAESRFTWLQHHAKKSIDQDIQGQALKDNLEVLNRHLDQLVASQNERTKSEISRISDAWIVKQAKEHHGHLYAAVVDLDKQIEVLQAQRAGLVDQVRTDTANHILAKNEPLKVVREQVQEKVERALFQSIFDF